MNTIICFVCAVALSFSMQVTSEVEATILGYIESIDGSDSVMLISGEDSIPVNLSSTIVLIDTAEVIGEGTVPDISEESIVIVELAYQKRETHDDRPIREHAKGRQSQNAAKTESVSV